jgi:endonuclease III
MPRISKKRQKLLLKQIHDILFEQYGQLHCTLDYETPVQLLVATILSAQCTDVRVNKVTPELFRKYPDCKAFVQADTAELEELIRTCGFFRAKGKSILEACRGIVERFDGIVPDKMEDLVSLHGIGRKTANVILGDAFEVPGFPVDTHVKRVLNRLGCVNSEDPVKIEKEVNAVVDSNYWTNFSHMIIIHGREVCHARKPVCENCKLNETCPFGIKYLRK